MSVQNRTRIERDTMGEMEVPAGAYIRMGQVFLGFAGQVERGSSAPEQRNVSSLCRKSSREARSCRAR